VFGVRLYVLVKKTYVIRIIENIKKNFDILRDRENTNIYI